VHDRGADLALDVVADDRQAGVGELLRPHRVGGDEDRQRVDEGAPGVDRGLGVELVGLLGAHRKVRDYDVHLGVAQHLDHVDRIGRRLLDDLAVVLTEAVEGRSTLDGHAGRRDVGELDRVVLAGDDRLGQVHADLLGVHVERGDEPHVGDVVVAEGHVHEARDTVVRIGVLVVLHALDEGRGAVTHTDDGDADGAHRVCLLVLHGRSWCGRG
jgi:hypothetical protein